MSDDSRLRIAYLVSQYPTVNHTFILREIRTLRNLGHHVSVISVRAADRNPQDLDPEEREEIERTQTILHAGPSQILAAHAYAFVRHTAGVFSGIVCAFRLAGPDLRKIWMNLIYLGEAIVAGYWIRRQGIAHVHTHFASTIALLLERVFPVRFSATIHGPDEFNDAAGFYLAEKVARASFVCAISNYGRSQLMRCSDRQHWSKLEVVPLGINPRTFAPRPHRENPARFEILCVGRLAPAKGHHILIAAVQRLIEQGRASIRLRLVGEGPLRKDLEDSIAALRLQEYVRLEGACNPERVLQMYAETDLFALASFAEGVPVVLMEAMAMEIPCVATWITGVPELIRDGVDGCLVAPGDAEQLACAMARLMDDAALRVRLGKSARSRVLEKYDLERNTARLAELLKRRISGAVNLAK